MTAAELARDPRLRSLRKLIADTAADISAEPTLGAVCELDDESAEEIAIAVLGWLDDPPRLIQTVPAVGGVL